MSSKNEFYSLMVIAVLISLIIGVLGRELLCLWISLVCAYLLKRPHQFLVKLGMRDIPACSLLVSIFFILILFLLLGVIPPMVTQAYNFLSNLPDILATNQESITIFIDNISAKVPKSTINDLIISAKQYLTVKSTDGVLFIINLLPITFEILLYFILVPIMLFFLLKDGSDFSKYYSSIAPKSAKSIKKFWIELDNRLGSYLQGKIIEMLIVGGVSALTYSLFNLEFSLLLSGLMAISVLIPVLGAVIATIPLAFISLWQFGSSSHELIYLLLAHGLILIADGNILVPILFSEKLCLHPLVILIGIIFFGAIMGFWGLFFAIPLIIVISLFLDNFRINFVEGN